ncbi:MAG: TIM barrel protein [Candidatus Burarchaeum sp.]|nr:TIM barrel protein [Candidatus Burarchaeum sp.]MDO8340132.1 TIM barrel protein [Candidatus Burarchaeum sp.]
MLFGPAGIPIACQGGTLEGVRTVAELGLGAMEVEFVRGVHMGPEQVRAVGAEAKRLNISLSCHAPYWINCCARTNEKLVRSVRNIIDTAKVAHALGARIIVFHPGYYLDRPSSECAALTRQTLTLALEQMHALGINDVLLGPELMGKGSQFGSLDEIIALAANLPQTKPVIDFAHYHARGNGAITAANAEADYAAIFSKLESSLGKNAVTSFHAHFSEVEYTDKGERRHLELGTTNEPPVKPFLKLCAEQDYSGTIICETPLLEQDALRMQRIFASYLPK